MIVILHNIDDAHSITERTIVLNGRPARVRLDLGTMDVPFPSFEAEVLAAMEPVDDPRLSISQGETFSARQVHQVAPTETT